MIYIFVVVVVNRCKILSKLIKLYIQILCILLYVK